MESIVPLQGLMRGKYRWGIAIPQSFFAKFARMGGKNAG
jgi:hypothetical protein